MSSIFDPDTRRELIQMGFLQGEQQGIINNQKQVYGNLGNLGFSREQIKNILGVSEEKLQEIENSLLYDKKK
jgi:hypothetical protein